MNKKVVVMSDAVGTSSYVEDEKDAFVFKSGSVHELSELIQRIASEIDSFDKIRESGRKLYEKEFSQDALLGRLERVGIVERLTIKCQEEI